MSEPRRQIVLGKDEFEGLKRIIDNPQPVTPEARAAWERYKAQKREERAIDVERMVLKPENHE